MNKLTTSLLASLSIMSPAISETEMGRTARFKINVDGKPVKLTFLFKIKRTMVNGTNTPSDNFKSIAYIHADIIDGPNSKNGITLKTLRKIIPELKRL